MIKRAFLLACLALPALAALPASAAPNGLADLSVFPIPWKPGSGDQDFDAAALTFANLPPGTRVTIFTVRGQKVWQDLADATGTLLWTGVNEHRRTVASGTYLVVFDALGKKTSRRVVLIR